MYQYYSYTIASSVQLSAVRWFLEEDDGEAESAKSEMMVSSSVLCDLMPHCFVICDRRDRGVDFMLYIVQASKHGRKRRDVAFFYSFNQSINQSGSFGSIFLALATPSTMVPTMPKAIFTFGYTLWMLLTVPLGFAPVCYLYKSQLY